MKKIIFFACILCVYSSIQSQNLEKFRPNKEQQDKLRKATKGQSAYLTSQIEYELNANAQNLTQALKHEITEK